MGMSVTEFIKKKNKIIANFINNPKIPQLVPDDQIVECERLYLHTNSDVDICPYCEAYVKKNNKCDECPMFKADNKCSYLNSTYTQNIDELIKQGYVDEFNESTEFISVEKLKKELIDLVDEYNKQFQINKGEKNVSR